MSTAEVKLGNVTHPVADVTAAATFYSDSLGITTKFIDGDRYAALDAGGTTLALAAPVEDLTECVCASFKVADVGTALESIRRAGGRIVHPRQQGPHEVRAVAADPWNNLFIVYGPR
ncbi:VOC family protein [Rhodococcus sp. NCIMB 12038]|uniref:VOC family protein n=1 Tax=Rhodococcus sp. NCIMB 12038 TaxID=933800 RepID=UPI000B3C601F|nr:VOC family protein [Rhodococcus sp. NCIMB 12038]OUS92043.1 glyoxalase [Rhodococcus sp. NCIMB 12038]